MGQIEKSASVSLPEKRRKDHVNMAGDIFFNRLNKSYIRLSSRNDDTWSTEIFDFCTLTWQNFRNIPETDLKYDHILFLEDWNEIFELTEKMKAGTIKAKDIFPQNNDVPDTMELTGTCDRASITSQLEQTELIESKMLSIQNMMSAMVECQNRRIRKLKDEMEGTMTLLKHQINNARKVLSVLETYSGCEETIEIIRTGSYASIEEDICLRQRILFMDEEMMIRSEEGGADYTDKELFYNWLQNKENMKIILPEEKCVVVMKPRRFEKRYTENNIENELYNQWNFHSFVLIRNGENVWSIESRNLCVYDSTIPHSDEMEDLQRQVDQNNLFAENRIIDIRYRSILLGMFLQGICDRTDIFQHKSVTVLKMQGIRFIFDDENLIGNGMKEWPDFLKEINKQITHGSRVIYIKPYSPNKGGKFFRLFNKYREPDDPSTGIYNIEIVEGKFTFLYLPSKKVFPRETWKDIERKRRERWIPYTDYLINYDALSLENIEIYLNDRSQRKYYQNMIPLLLRLKKERQYEKDEEIHFRQLLKDTIPSDYPNEKIEKVIDDSIKWWKDKVIMKRRLTSDDAKAWRMIKSKVIRTLNEQK